MSDRTMKIGLAVFLVIAVFGRFLHVALAMMIAFWIFNKMMK